MYYAAMNSTGCRLTALGRFYWGLADDRRISPAPGDVATGRPVAGRCDDVCGRARGRARCARSWSCACSSRRWSSPCPRRPPSRVRPRTCQWPRPRLERSRTPARLASRRARRAHHARPAHRERGGDLPRGRLPDGHRIAGQLRGHRLGAAGRDRVDLHRAGGGRQRRRRAPARPGREAQGVAQRHRAGHRGQRQLRPAVPRGAPHRPHGYPAAPRREAAVVDLLAAVGAARHDRIAGIDDREVHAGTAGHGGIDEPRRGPPRRPARRLRPAGRRRGRRRRSRRLRRPASTLAAAVPVTVPSSLPSSTFSTPCDAIAVAERGIAGRDPKGGRPPRATWPRS